MTDALTKRPIRGRQRFLLFAAGVAVIVVVALIGVMLALR
jgi:hypothetical protein